jgi:hypothetical protein
MFGSGIYFAASEKIARGKAWHGKQAGSIIKASVDLGDMYETPGPVGQPNKNLCWEMLQGNVPGHAGTEFHSVWARAAPHGPMQMSDEWIVYNAYQVEIESITDSVGKAVDFLHARAKPKPRSLLSHLMDFAL